MKYQIVKVYQGEMTHKERALNLLQLCNMCDTTPEIIIRLVNEGILEPEGNSRLAWRFTVDEVLRAQKAHRLQRDLELNLAGTALALKLIDKIKRLEFMLEKTRQ
jgi:chaperone modulatory protein CbpM